MFVFRARSLGGNRNEKRRGSGCLQAVASVGAQDLFGDQDVSKGGNFCLIDQMKRAAASVGMNLMEGAMRLGSKEYRQFVGIGEARLGKFVINYFSPEI